MCECAQAGRGGVGTGRRAGRGRGVGDARCLGVDSRYWDFFLFVFTRKGELSQCEFASGVLREEGLGVSGRMAEPLGMESGCLFRNRVWREGDQTCLGYCLLKTGPALATTCLPLRPFCAQSSALHPHFFIGLPTSGNHRTNPCLLLSFRRVKMALKVMVSSIFYPLGQEFFF